MTRPSCPKEHILVLPAPLLRLRAEELQAMIIVWGAIGEAIRQGQEPVFPAGELAQLIADVSGCSRRNAYRLLARLANTLLDGKRLLRADPARESRLPAIDRRPSRRMVIWPGEALEPWLRLVREAFATRWPPSDHPGGPERIEEEG